MFKGENKFNLNKIGGLEFMFALYPIIAGYSYGSIYLDYFFPVLMCMCAMVLRGGLLPFKPLVLLTIFVFLHEIILSFFLEAISSAYIIIAFKYIIFLLSIMIITPAINFEKLVGSIFLVSIITSIGIIYHFLIIQGGGSVTPIKLPFFPGMVSDSRLYEVGTRPVSFFWEPASYVTYMMIPLFISLYYKKMIISGGIILMMFLSTSSTGIFLSIGMLMCYILSQKIPFRLRFSFFIIGVTSIYFLLSSSLFESGIEKIENTDVEQNIRLMNGPLLVTNMPIKHLIWGFPNLDPTDYYDKTNYVTTILFKTNNGTIFVPTFWLILAKFGVIGLILYLNVFIKLFVLNKDLLPYLSVLIVAWFSQGISISSTYVFQMVFILSFIIYHENNKIIILK